MLKKCEYNKIMDFIHSYSLGDNVNYEDIIRKMKATKKYDKLIIVNDDAEYTTAVIDLGDNDEDRKITKKDFTFHLGKYKRVNKEKRGQKCTICQNELEENEYYRQLNGCNHCFHKKCVDEWFFKSKSYGCPLCRNNPFSLGNK